MKQPVDLYMMGMRKRPRCIIEDACNRVNRRMNRPGERQWRNGVVFSLSAVSCAFLIAYGLVWMFA